MARIRTIKPELPHDRKLARLSRVTRYHWLLIWTITDDAGYFRAAPRYLLGELYEHDRDVSEAEVDKMTAELVEGGFLELRQSVDGPVGRVTNWKKHQKIDRPSMSRLEGEFAKGSRHTREGASTGPRILDLGSRTVDRGPEEQPDLDDVDQPAEPYREPPKPEPAKPAGIWQPSREADLAKRLTSDAGRSALTAVIAVSASDPGKAAIVAEVTAMLDGLRGLTYTASGEAMDRALADYVANGMSQGRWNAAHFRACVRRAMQPEDAPARAAAENGRPLGDGEAAVIMGKIRELVQTQTVQAGGAKQFIRKTDLEALGADVAQAVAAIGGTQRIIETPPGMQGIVNRDFAAALRAVRAQSPVLTT